MPRDLRRVGLVTVAALLLLPGCETTNAESPEARLKRDTGVDWVVDFDPDTGAASNLVALGAPSSAPGTPPEQSARAFLDRYRDLFKLTDTKAELALDKVFVDLDGESHVLFHQRAANLDVAAARIAVHFTRDGALGAVAAHVAPAAARTSPRPALDAAAAIAAATKDIAAKHPAFDPSGLDPASPALVYYPMGAHAPLAYTMRLSGRTADASYAFVYVIDAMTGVVLRASDSMQKVTGSGKGVLGDTKTFEVDERGSLDPRDRYAMVRTGSATQTQIETYDDHSFSVVPGFPAFPITSNALDVWDAQGPVAGAAVDAHAWLAVVDGWYRRRGLASYDGKGAKLKAIVHQNVFGLDKSDTRDNAAWDGNGSIHIGDGDVELGGGFHCPAAALDAMAHEFTHAVTQHASSPDGEQANGLSGEGRSGALNESLSDIFAAFIDHEIAPPSSSPFVLGETLFTNDKAAFQGERDMAHPSRFGFPDHASKLTPETEQHFGANVPNNAWYLMTVGGTNDTSHLGVREAAALGWQRSESLWWTTLFTTIHKDSIAATTAMSQLGIARTKGYPLEPIACAWLATGVLGAPYLEKYGVQCPTNDATPSGNSELGLAIEGALNACLKAKEKLVAIPWATSSTWRGVELFGFGVPVGTSNELLTVPELYMASGPDGSKHLVIGPGAEGLGGFGTLSDTKYVWEADAELPGWHTWTVDRPGADYRSVFGMFGTPTSPSAFSNEVSFSPDCGTRKVRNGGSNGRGGFFDSYDALDVVQTDKTLDGTFTRYGTVDSDNTYAFHYDFTTQRWQIDLTDESGTRHRTETLEGSCIHVVETWADQTSDYGCDDVIRP